MEARIKVSAAGLKREKAQGSNRRGRRSTRRRSRGTLTRGQSPEAAAPHSDPSRTGACAAEKRHAGSSGGNARIPWREEKAPKGRESQERCRRETKPTRIVRGSSRREGSQTLGAERTGEGSPGTSNPPIRQVLKGTQARERGRQAAASRRVSVRRNSEGRPSSKERR